MAVGFVPDDGHNGSWLRSGRRPQWPLASFRRSAITAVGFVPDDGHHGRWLRSGRRPSRPLASFRTTATVAVGFVPKVCHQGRWLRSGRRPSGPLASFRTTELRPLASFRTTAIRAVGFVPDDGHQGRWLRSGRRPPGPLASFRRSASRAVGFVLDDGHQGRCFVPDDGHPASRMNTSEPRVVRYWFRPGVARWSRARSGGNHAGHALDRHATRPRVCRDNSWGQSQPADLRRVFPRSTSKTAGSIQPRESAIMAVGFVPDDGRGRCGRCPRRAGTSVHRAARPGPLGSLGNLGGLSDGFRTRTLNPGLAKSPAFQVIRERRGAWSPYR